MVERTPEDEQRLIEITRWVNARNAELEASLTPPGYRRVGSPRGNWRTPQARVVRWIPPGYWLTQYGSTDQPFRAQPRFEGLQVVEVEVSMVRGRRSVEETAQLISKKPPKPAAAVCFFRTADLWLKGYLVAHTPNERNPNHVSVHYGEAVTTDRHEIARARWAEPDRVTLDSLAIPADEAQS